MTYNPDTKVYYGLSTDTTNRLSPAPQISFNTELAYANDSVIGYTYIVSISGTATALDLLNNNNTYGVDKVSAAIQKTRDIFALNGGNLYVLNKDNDTIFEARGGTVKNINIDESTNNWVNYVPYKIEIEFNEIIINGCSVTNTIDCSASSIDSSSPNLIDISDYKIKSFNDNWSFNLGDTIYSTYGEFNNQHFEVEYKISATGKHFFNDDNKVLPAWEQAKNFAQKRLVDQVTGLMSSIILQRQNGDDGCSATRNLSNIHGIGTPGGLDINTISSYGLYNETISCETSEADGSFSATYKAILKYNISSSLYSGNTLHTFTLSSNLQDDNKTRSKTITVQGSITGLIPGGLISSANTLELPNNGKLFIVYNNVSIDKYHYAYDGYNLIGGTSDLSSDFKQYLDISRELGSDTCSSPKPSSHTITHDYTNGIITYNTEYNSIRSCQGDRSYRNINISIEDSIPMIAEFVIPGRSNGPIIQYLGINTPKKLSINIDGVVDQQQYGPTDLQTWLSGVCNNGISQYLPGDIPNDYLGATYKLVQNQETANPIDGSYSISRTYIVCEA